MNLIGREVIITTRDSFVFDQWGTVRFFDGEYYHIAIYNDTFTTLIFTRDEFRVLRKKG